MKHLGTFKSITLLWLLNLAFFIYSFFIQDIQAIDHNQFSFNQSQSAVCASETLKNKNYPSVDSLNCFFIAGPTTNKNLKNSSLPTAQETLGLSSKKSFLKEFKNYSNVLTYKNSSRGPPTTFS